MPFRLLLKMYIKFSNNHQIILRCLKSNEPNNENHIDCIEIIVYKMEENKFNE